MQWGVTLIPSNGHDKALSATKRIASYAYMWPCPGLVWPTENVLKSSISFQFVSSRGSGARGQGSGARGQGPEGQGLGGQEPEWLGSRGSGAWQWLSEVGERNYNIHVRSRPPLP